MGLLPLCAEKITEAAPCATTLIPMLVSTPWDNMRTGFPVVFPNIRMALAVPAEIRSVNAPEFGAMLPIGGGDASVDVSPVNVT